MNSLQALKPKYPLYPQLNVQIRGYDFPILECYQSWIHKVAEAMDFDVDEWYYNLTLLIFFLIAFSKIIYFLVMLFHTKNGKL